MQQWKGPWKRWMEMKKYLHPDSLPSRWPSSCWTRRLWWMKTPSMSSRWRSSPECRLVKLLQTVSSRQPWLALDVSRIVNNRLPRRVSKLFGMFLGSPPLLLIFICSLVCFRTSGENVPWILVFMFSEHNEVCKEIRYSWHSDDLAVMTVETTITASPNVTSCC